MDLSNGYNGVRGILGCVWGGGGGEAVLSFGSGWVCCHERSVVVPEYMGDDMVLTHAWGVGRGVNMQNVPRCACIAQDLSLLNAGVGSMGICR